MIVAVKDDLKIQVTVADKKVNIEMPEMEDVLVLWNKWIQQEERMAESFLRSQYESNPYCALKDYFLGKGWYIEQ
jgi:hypothetical protein